MTAVQELSALVTPAAEAEGAPEVSIVMPCLNEAATVATCVRKARRGLEELGISGEIIVADNGSTDGSPVLAEAAGARVVTVAQKGYGAAVLGGVAAAHGTYVIMGDADDSYDFTKLGPFVEKLREGCELVMGDRFAGGIRPGAMPWLHRYVGNPALSGVGRLFFGSRCRDFHCGMRGFERSAIGRLGLRTTGMELASEMVVKAALHGLRVGEVAVTLWPDGRAAGRPPHLRSWRDGWRHLRFLLMYSPRWLFLYPGLLLMAVGLLAGVWLLPGPRRIAGTTLDVHTLMYAAVAVVVGFEAASFAVFARVFATVEGLLPEDARLNRWLGWVRLEGGIVAGILLVVFGVGMSVWAVSSWRARSFGALDPSREMRLVIPAATALILGCQVVLGSFMVSILRLGRR